MPLIANLSPHGRYHMCDLDTVSSTKIVLGNDALALQPCFSLRAVRVNDSVAFFHFLDMPAAVMRRTIDLNVSFRSRSEGSPQ